ncbi:MAG: ABC-three component system middle component 6 [Acutalibacteraceae bacterium]
MILPNKYVSIGDSYIGESAKILSALGKKQFTVDKLWDKINNSAVIGNLTFEKYIYVITFMFTCGLISYDEERGVLYNENMQS